MAVAFTSAVCNEERLSDGNKVATNSIKRFYLNIVRRSIDRKKALIATARKLVK